MNQPAPPLPFAVAQPTGVKIIGCLSLPGNMQLWVVQDDASAKALVKILGGPSLILTLAKLRELWQAGQSRILVPEIRPKPMGEN